MTVDVENFTVTKFQGGTKMNYTLHSIILKGKK